MAIPLSELTRENSYFRRYSKLIFMKKLIFSLGILIVIALPGINAHAQLMYCGVRAGANLANESANSLPSGASNNFTLGFLAGLQFDYLLDDSWGLSIQMLYDEKGALTQYSSYYATGTVRTGLNYIEMPLLIKKSFGDGDRRLYLFAGPSLGYFLSGAQNTNLRIQSTGYYDYSVPVAQPLPDSAVNSFDISAVVGAGVSSKWSSGQIFFLEASFAFGLISSAHEGIYGAATDYYQPQQIMTTKSRDIRIAAGILFPLD
jgi:hypothetical protein